MRDEIYDREYQAGRADFHAAIERAVLAIGRGFATTFDAIHDIQFAAPWTSGPDRSPDRRTGPA